MPSHHRSDRNGVDFRPKLLDQSGPSRLLIAWLLATACASGQWLPFAFIDGMPGENFGTSIATGGDYNGDGTPDFAVGGGTSGNVYVYSGVAPPVLLATLAGSPLDLFGFALDFANVDGGVDSEIVIGSPGAFAGAGRVEVFKFPFALLNTNNGVLAAGQLGASVVRINANADALDDYAVGAPGADQVTVFLGGTFSANCVFNGTAGTNFGFALASGELDGIFTREELVVGAPDLLGPTAGSVSVFDLATCTGCTTPGLEPAEEFGYSVAVVGRLAFGSPVGNVLVGAPKRNSLNLTDSGAAVFYSPSCVLECTLSSGVAGDQFGTAVASAGDVNTDTFDDYLISSPFSDAGGVDSGTVALYDGSSQCDGELCSRDGIMGGEQFGWKVQSFGDLNMDGALDALIAAPLSDTGGIDSGRVEFVSLPPGTFIHAFSNPFPGFLQFSISGGAPNSLYFLAVALNPVTSVPSGWFFGIDIDFQLLLAELQSGPPFVGILDGAGGLTFFFGGFPPGIPMDSVVLELDMATTTVLRATPPQAFLSS